MSPPKIETPVEIFVEPPVETYIETPTGIITVYAFPRYAFPIFKSIEQFKSIMAVAGVFFGSFKNGKYEYENSRKKINKSF